MAIHVTPIPKLTNFGTPAFTLGSSNAAGDSQIAVASNSTLDLGMAGDISCKVYNNADVSIANNSSTILAFNSESYDTDSMHDNTTNNSRVTIKTAGKYVVVGFIKWSSNSTGRRQISIMVNGSQKETIEDSSNTAHHHYQQVVAEMSLSVNDYLELQAYQNSGGALDSLTMNSIYPGLAAMKVVG